MQQEVFADRLDVLGILVGAFVALVGLGTLVGMPWQHSSSSVTVVLQILGALATVALGAGLAWLTHTQ
jgi:hypothetical protein